MFGRMFRAWPRLLVAMALLSVFLLLTWATGVANVPIASEDLAGPFGALAFSLAFLIVVFAAAAAPVIVLAVLAPGLLPMVELLLLALLLTVPFSLARTALGLPAWIDCVALGAAAYAFAQITSGVWLAGVGRRDTRVRRSVFLVPEPVERVWARIVPLPENAGRYYWPKAEFLPPPAGSTADFVLHAPVRRSLLRAPDAYWIEALDPGRSVTLRSAPLTSGFGVSERQTFRLEPVGTRTRVELEVSFLDVPLAQRLRLWLNNDPCEYLVSLQNHARGRRDSTVHGRQVLPA